MIINRRLFNIIFIFMSTLVNIITFRNIFLWGLYEHFHIFLQISHPSL